MILRLAKVHIILQVLDGLLTYTGISFYGTHLEGNPVLKSIMDTIGAGPTLILAKGLAICVLLAVIYYRDYLESIEMKIALITINFVYLFAAIVPWMIFLVNPSFFSCVLPQ
jgi:hypothetical protein